MLILNMCVCVLDVVSTDRGVYTCNLHHHYCQIHQSVQIQLNVTKSGEMWTNTDINHWLELQSHRLIRLQLPMIHTVAIIMLVHASSLVLWGSLPYT